jgi:3-deoxy-D-manno-octulosonic-acid transferase
MKTLLFDLAFFLYGLFALPVFVAKGKHREGWGERWGRVPAETAARLRGRDVFWVHGVSVGEARLACHLVSRIRRRLPGMTVLVTTTTASGRQVARKHLAPEDEVLFMPFDLSFAVRRFLTAVKPRAVVVMETEIWPNLLRELERREIPVLIANGRISASAFRRYRPVRWAIAGSLRRVRLILAQSREHRERFLALGADPGRVRAAGNMKFDLEGAAAPSDAAAALGERLRAEPDTPVLLASSTHPGEDETLLEAYARLKGRHPRLKLVLAPRHLERIPSVEALTVRRNLPAVRLSRFLAEPSRALAEIVLVDQWGVLNLLYPLADAVFVGGSLVPVGGHNLAEAAVHGRAVLCGPHMENFADMLEEFTKEGAVTVVRDACEIEERAAELLRDRGARDRLGAKARQTVLKNQGAAERAVEEILQCLAPFGMGAPAPRGAAVPRGSA